MQEPTPLDADLTDVDAGNASWATDEIEQAYLRALDAIAAVEQDVGLSVDAESPAANPDEGHAAQRIPAEPGITAAPANPSQQRADPTHATAHPSDRATGRDKPHGPSDGVTPKQIIEAALFVGGAPLVTKKLCSLFQGEFDADFVERCIEELNDQYQSENRPYEIHFGEGGYRMQLRPEFESVNNRVYGYGPKEVRLSQEALEVLALVAYQQPVSRQQIEQWDHPNAASVLRQLLRRQVIALERGDDGPDDVHYVTTRRFLSLFGLGTLNELPRPEDLELK